MASSQSQPPVMTRDWRLDDSQHNLHYGHSQHEDGQKMWSKIEPASVQVERENHIVRVE
jgi:hypothetical protein